MDKTLYLKGSETKMQQQSTSISAFEKEYAEFIDMAAHDLDAPLRKLTFLVGMLMDKLSQDKNIQSYTERIENCVVDMRSLIDDLSVLARITSDKREITSCEIDTIIHQALEGLRAHVKEKNAEVTTFSLPVIKGDARQISCLFKNLLENAIKFSKKDKFPEIHIRSSILPSKEKDLLNLPGDRLYYKIEITDNGIGFKEEYAEKIFRPLVRLHGKSQFPGNGIGLAICKRIMDIHDGIIYAESRENEGARFILILPESP
jgi:signal transduction histidine kinase